jgi:hypothetical protein
MQWISRMRTAYRFLTRDETLGPGEWVDSCPDFNEIRYLPSREAFRSFIEQIEAEGWELVSATQAPEHSMSEGGALETWVYRRTVQE